MTTHFFISDPATWVERYGDYLYGYAFKRVRDSASAEDLVQETLIAALEARGKFSGRASEKTWLVGILKNKVFDHFRARSRFFDNPNSDQNEDEAEDFVPSGSRKGNWKPDRRPAEWAVDFSDPVERSEFVQFLKNCLLRLETQLADAFVLREMEMLESKEICNILGITQTNLRVTMFRVRQKVRRCLESKWLTRKKS